METEVNLIEETFALIKQLDETEGGLEAAMLEARIAERSDELGTLDGFGLFAVDGSLLAVTLDREQAVAIQTALLLAEGGAVTSIQEVETDVSEFVHPETSVESIVAVLIEGEG